MNDNENNTNDYPEIYFDEYSKIRILQPEQARHAKELQSESNEFISGT